MRNNQLAYYSNLVFGIISYDIKMTTLHLKILKLLNKMQNKFIRQFLQNLTAEAYVWKYYALTSNKL